VIYSGSAEPARTGSYDAWLDGYGKTTTDTLSVTVTLPTGCSSYTSGFWMHIDTAETTTVKFTGSEDSEYQTSFVIDDIW
jgi:hypothetical protein